MLRRRVIQCGLAVLALFSLPRPTRASGASAPAEVLKFDSIDGGPLDLASFRGGPVLVVNTASRCGFTGQYDGLQALYDRYRARGLTVVGVPSDSFRQELASDAAVKDFCETNFAISFPMTSVVDVTGPRAHPFYAWARDQGVEPSWNFSKILLDATGAITADFGPLTGPDSARLISAIEPLLRPA